MSTESFDSCAEGDDLIQERGLFAELLLVFSARGENAKFHLVLMIGGNRSKLVLLKWIGEALQHLLGKLPGPIDAPFECGHNFLEDQLLEPRPDFRMLDCFADSLDL